MQGAGITMLENKQPQRLALPRPGIPMPLTKDTGLKIIAHSKQNENEKRTYAVYHRRRRRWYLKTNKGQEFS